MIPNASLVRLTPESEIKPFDCGHEQLSGFLFEDAKDYAEQLMAVTYLYETDDRTLAYFSVLNDSIRKQDTTVSRWKKVLKMLPWEKRGYPSHPAVKVGRFAVDRTCQRDGLGSGLMDFIKGYFLDVNKTGCRFITVDSYSESIDFYKRNGFNFLTDNDKGEETRIMYFDLMVYANLNHLPE